MTSYYGAEDSVSDELYHFGIKGQKWGIRRYQNPDGTLTEEGKQRYGNFDLGKYAVNNHKLSRRILTGDIPLGSKRHYDKKEVRLQNKIEKRRNSGKNVSQSLLRKYNGVKINNIERDVSNSYVSTGKIFAQNLILHGAAKYYREQRNSGYGRLKSYKRARAMKRQESLGMR